MIAPLLLALALPSATSAFESSSGKFKNVRLSSKDASRQASLSAQGPTPAPRRFSTTFKPQAAIAAPLARYRARDRASGATPYARPAACLLGAVLYLIVGTIGLYLGWRLFAGRIRAFSDLQLLSTVAATLSLIAIVFGNWLYIFYRANNPEGPQLWFLANMPMVHKIFFEFKEFTALFTLPLTVTAAFILWYYGAQVLDRKWMRYTVAVLLALSFFYLVVAFGLGAAVTKLRPA
jgi:hypothetical protein